MSGLNLVLKFQMTPYSDNAYDITTFFVVFYALLLPSFIVRHQMVELNWGSSLLVHYRGILGPVQNKVKVQMT